MNPMIPRKKNGQILIIFAVALVALLALAALTLDGGTIFVDRRYSQGVADTASLAGAGAAALSMDNSHITYSTFSCDPAVINQVLADAYNAAQARAAANQVTNLDHDLTDSNGIEVVCVNNPNQFDKHIDVHTMITSNVNTSLIQLFYPGPIRNTVNAVVRVHPRTEFAYDRAVVSLGSQCGTNTGGVIFDGTSTVNIYNGGVYSNSCITSNGTIDVNVDTNMGVGYVGTLTENGNGSISPAPVQNGTMMPQQDIGPLSCSGPTLNSSSGGTISPGNYSTIKLTNGTLVLNSGLYCLSGNMSITGGEIDVAPMPDGSAGGVTIYLESGSLKISGNATAHLNAPTDTNVVPDAQVGILVYMAKGNSGNIDLEGTASSSFVGAIYAPDGTIDVGGTNQVNPTYNTQLVGQYVKVHGTADIKIQYKTTPPHMIEPTLDAIE